MCNLFLNRRRTHFGQKMKTQLIAITFNLIAAIALATGCQNSNSDIPVTAAASTKESEDIEKPNQEFTANQKNDPNESKVTIVGEDVDTSADDPDPELPSLAESLQNPAQDELEEQTEDAPPEIQTIDIPATWKRLSPKHEIWVDFAAKQVIAAGNICMTAGPLEMFACPRGTKEHESIVSLNALGSQIHTALLAMDVNPGHPVKWQDEYEAATGPVIHIDVVWSQDGQQKKIKAQQMVLNIKTEQPMIENWVFGGSATFTDESGETYYYGDAGELVCLSNFSTATMDVPVKSSDANEGLLFEANTKNIPEMNTKVYLVFKPEIVEKK